MKVERKPEALYRVTITHSNNDVTTLYTPDVTQVRNLQEIHSDVYVETSVPVWVPSSLSMV